MILNISIQNFQSVKKIDLSFAYPVILITGPTDNGKSAILRAIKNALFENVGGGYFRKELKNGKAVTASQILVDVETSIGKVKWSKQKTDSTYTLEVNGNTQIFENCGKTVPPAVTESLKLNTESIIGENLHYRNQFQPAFLLADRGPKDAYRFISSLMGADEVIKAMAVFESDAKALAKDVKASGLAVEAAQGVLDSYFTDEDITKMESSYSVLASMETSVDTLSDRISALTVISDLLKSVSTLQVSISSQLVLLNDLSSRKTTIEALFKDVSSVDSRITGLSTIPPIVSELGVLSDRIAKADSIVNSEIIPKLVCDHTRYVTVSGQIQSLSGLADLMKSVSSSLVSPPDISGLVSLHSDYALVSKKVTSLSDLCTLISSLACVESDLAFNLNLMDQLKPFLPKTYSGHYQIGNGVQVVGTVYVTDSSVVINEVKND